MTHDRRSTIYDLRYRRAIKLLVKERRQRGVSQAMLASLVGLNQPDISKIERLERRLDIVECWDIVLALTNKDLQQAYKLWEKIGESIS